MATMQWPVDKLTLINSALALTGNNPLSALDDGSDEYNVCSPVYERALAIMNEDHSWNWLTIVNPNLPAAPNAPTDIEFDTAYNLPEDLLHLIWVRVALGVDPTIGTVDSWQTSDYALVSGQLWLNSRGGPPPPPTPVVPAPVSIKYISSTQDADVVAGTPLYVAALQSFVMSGIYRGLHEDTAEADKLWAEGERLAQRARTRHDQQLPKRSLWNSRITAARRVRRPWPPMPGGWSGTGVPG